MKYEYSRAHVRQFLLNQNKRYDEKEQFLGIYCNRAIYNIMSKIFENFVLKVLD